MDYNEFAEKIKTKYPQYKDMDNRELATRMVEKYPQYNDVTFDTPKETTKGIDFTPSGLVDKTVNAINAGIEAPIRMIKDKQSLPEAIKSGYESSAKIQKEMDKKMPLQRGSQKFLTDMAAYSTLPILRGGGVGRFIGNAAIQGGLPGALETMKREGDLTGFGSGTGIAAGLQGALAGVPYVGRGVQRVIDNPNVQNAVTKGLEVLTSVPQKYSQRALEAELAGNSILKGKFDPETAYRPIEEKLTQAKGMLPTKESYANEFYKLGQKAKTGIENLKEAAGQEISDMLGNLQAEPIQINGLKNSINSLVNNFSRGGNINPAEIRSGRDLELVRDMLGMKGQEQLNQDLINYYNANKVGIGTSGALNKDAENAAFEILAQATGKNKNWLKSQLNANVPLQSTKKRQEFIKELLEQTDDKIENINPAWRQHFPEFNWGHLQEGGADTTELTKDLLNKILRRDFKAPTELLSPEELAAKELGGRYNNLLSEIAANPSNQVINNSYNKLQNILNDSPDWLKDELVLKYANDVENLQNIANPKVKPIDLHNAKEILYDMANYDTAGGTRNDVLKGVANQINNFIRSKYPQYKVPNDKFALIKNVEGDLGGINSSTIANKLAGYGSKGNIASGLDQKLRNINTLLPRENQFIKQTEDLVKSQNEVNNILKTISEKYENNVRPLADKTSQKFENAINDLQKMTGVNFMDDLTNVRAREALDKLLPGQGGGSGSAQGAGNLIRAGLAGSGLTAGALFHNPLVLPGILSMSPKIMAKGTIQNLGKLYNAAGKQVPKDAQKLLNPLAAKLYATLKN